MAKKTPEDKALIRRARTLTRLAWVTRGDGRINDALRIERERDSILSALERRGFVDDATEIASSIY